jgi:hypothetical protein
VIANRVGITGDRETRKRTLREIVKTLRRPGEGSEAGGMRICANLVDGYWIARDATEWHEYLEAVKRDAVFRFHERRRMATAASEQVTGQRTFW